MAKPDIKLVAPHRSPSREALATAISDHAHAERDLMAAREAVGKARERAWDAQDRLAGLQERPAEATANPASVFIAAMRAGREPSVAEIEGPAKSRAAEEAAIQCEIDALTKTRAALDAAVIEREGAIKYAEHKIKESVAEVLRSETDVARLLKEAEAVAADIVSRRCALMRLQSLLPISEEKKAIDSFLAQPWLMHECNRTHTSHPAAQAVSRAHDALMRDADTELPR